MDQLLILSGSKNENKNDSRSQSLFLWKRSNNDLVWNQQKWVNFAKFNFKWRRWGEGEQVSTRYKINCIKVGTFFCKKNNYYRVVVTLCKTWPNRHDIFITELDLDGKID